MVVGMSEVEIIRNRSFKDIFGNSTVELYGQWREWISEKSIELRMGNTPR